MTDRPPQSRAVVGLAECAIPSRKGFPVTSLQQCDTINVTGVHRDNPPRVISS